MDVILKYSSKTDLKGQIIGAYLKSIQSNLVIYKRILADKNWASDGSDYHKRCRSEMQEKIKEIEKQNTLLK